MCNKPVQLLNRNLAFHSSLWSDSKTETASGFWFMTNPGTIWTRQTVEGLSQGAEYHLVAVDQSDEQKQWAKRDGTGQHSFHQQHCPTAQQEDVDKQPADTANNYVKEQNKGVQWLLQSWRGLVGQSLRKRIIRNVVTNKPTLLHLHLWAQRFLQLHKPQEHVQMVAAVLLWKNCGVNCMVQKWRQNKTLSGNLVGKKILPTVFYLLFSLSSHCVNISVWQRLTCSTISLHFNIA